MAIVVLFGVLMAKQYRGDFVEQTELAVVSDRAGLVVDPGSKVTLNGVEIGRVAGVDVTEVDGHEQALIVLEVKDEYGWMGVLRFNLLQPPFNNVKLRRAFLAAANQYDFLRAAAGEGEQHQPGDEHAPGVAERPAPE